MFRGAELRVMLGDQDLTDRFAPRLLSLTLTEKRDGEADQLDISVHDVDGRMKLPADGAVLTLQLGWRGERLVDKGSFKVDEVEHSGPPDMVTIRARSADLTSTFRRRREKTWRDTTLGAIAQEVASRNGWKANVAAELASIEIPIIAQDQKSDMALLRRLGREHDAVATVKKGTLILSPIGKGESAGGAAIAPATIARSEGDRHVFRRIDRDQKGGVTAAWHDQNAGARKTVKVGGAKGGTARRLKRVYNSEADARAAAEAQHKRDLRGGYELELDLALGRPELFPETRITVTGFKEEIAEHSWLIAETRHSLDPNRGLTTRLKLETT